MQTTIGKWGNSLGIRIPSGAVDALSLSSGDNVSLEIKGNCIVIKKEKSVRDIFESFYGKPMEELSSEDLGECEEMDWGPDVGGEAF